MEEQQKTVMVLTETITINNTDAGNNVAQKWMNDKKDKNYQVIVHHMKKAIICEATKVEIIEE